MSAKGRLERRHLSLLMLCDRLILWVIPPPNSAIRYSDYASHSQWTVGKCHSQSRHLQPRRLSFRQEKLRSRLFTLVTSTSIVNILWVRFWMQLGKIFITFQPGSDAICTKPICCRPYADKVGPVFLSAGAMGEHGCDTTTALAQNLLHTISANNKFSIFTGDVVEGTNVIFA